jgi:UDP:flavonoid glycosyltransferase YjiC (YdhE family)
MNKAKIIVFSGGHGTCFETIKNGKPSICIPTQPEQVGNVKKMQQLGCSVSVKNKPQFELALQEIEKRTDFYKTNVAKLRDYSNRFNGLDQALSIIEGFSKT